MTREIFPIIIYVILAALNSRIQKLKITPSSFIKRCTWLFTILPLAAMVTGLVNKTALYDFLVLLQNGWMIFCGGIFLIAALPFLIARIERRRHADCVTARYVKWNLILNLAGAASAAGTFCIMGSLVGDMTYVMDFPLSEITSVLFTICLWAVLAYQGLEQGLYRAGEITDHDPSLAWHNQKCNVLYLVTVYFVSIFSAEMVVSYTFYCYIHHIMLEMKIRYYILLFLILTYFHLCSQHRRKHVYFLFLLCVPFILVSSVYWFSWFSMSNGMLIGELVFILSQFVIYMAGVFVRYGAVRIGRWPPEEDGLYRVRWQIGDVRIGVRSIFVLVFPTVFILSYIILWMAPIVSRRISYNEARNQLEILCEETEKDAQEVLSGMKRREWYDAKENDFSMSKYLNYIFSELKAELLEKRVIETDSRSVSYERLANYCREH